jgi:hypothetical protein
VKLEKRGGPRLLHLALSVAATVGFLAFDAASRADVIDVSAVEYASLKKAMRRLDAAPAVHPAAPQTLALLETR